MLLTSFYNQLPRNPLTNYYKSQTVSNQRTYLQNVASASAFVNRYNKTPM